MSVKYIFITGGVVSSLGKGITAASIGLLLESRELKIAMLKLDPYLNVDPGTMNPFQHGEVYVTDDGAETDLDLGHYYRYTHSPLSKASNSTSGQIYDQVIKKERKGDYLGKTVQVIPHVTDEIKERINACSAQEKTTQIVIVEIGGTVGDIESLPFLEAIRQFRYERPKDCINIHLTYVPYLKAAGEVKTKPTQHSVQVLREIGIVPDLILCRCEQALTDEIKAKISLFCSVPQDAVIDEKDVAHSIYEVPIDLHAQRLDEMICKSLGLKTKNPDLSAWEKMVYAALHPKKKVVIGIVGKYMDHQDAYKSVFESLHHAAIKAGVGLEIRRFESDRIVENGSVEKAIQGCDGYLVPGGFGERGWEGKILTARYCRENQIPYFGLCLGMQVMIVEFARHVLGLKNAHSTEVNPNTPDPVISMLSEQKKIQMLGGTMRLGAYPCEIKKGSLAHKAYGKTLVWERHRHRYEFNNQYKQAFEEKGMLFSGTLEKEHLCEISEIPSHPWMLGVQFHPEFKSKPLAAHPLFADFIASTLLEKRAAPPKKKLMTNA
ncbi:MAG: CTP synthase [Chlamydiae bacterium RIFCSPHIGHO2_12_FULL_49_9]|nr:MAG: CTP synthase [Chlamydiae bacterium RIFCSPHIGHO2_12_FULL_49_9]